MPKVSVIVPVYGVEKYIKKCARTLFEQTLDDIEYIFVNDCTKDNSMEILSNVLENYSQRKSQVRIINHKHNQGLARTREDGIRAATGEYIATCDSDDWVDVDIYREMYLEAISNDRDLVICDISYIEENGTRSDHSGIISAEALFEDTISDRIIPFLKNCIFKRSFRDGFMYPAGDMAEDIVLVYQLAKRCKNIGYVQDCFYNYRVNQQSITYNPSKEACISRFKSFSANLKILDSFLKENTTGKRMGLKSKVIAKSFLLPVIQYSDVFRLWRRSYKCLTPRILVNGSYGIRTKLLFILADSGLLTLYKKIWKKRK